MNLFEHLGNPPVTKNPTFSITQLAREFKVTTRTIRFYEDKGLLTPKRQGTTRIYNPRDRVRLQLVLRGKRLGFSLDEIAEIIDMYDAEPGEQGQIDYLLRRLEQQRDILLQQKQDLEQTLGELEQIANQCRQRLAAVND